MLYIHDKFLSSCIKECLLSDPKLYKLLSKIMVTISEYVSLNIRFIQTYLQDEQLDSSSRSIRRDIGTNHIKKTVQIDQYKSMIITSEV